MRFLLIGLTIALFSLTTACSELALTRSPEPEATDMQEQSEPEHNQPEHNQPEPGEQVAQSPESLESTESGPSAQQIEDLKSILSVKMGVPSHEISLVSAEAVDWPDACLGVSNPDEFCAQVITPGYRIILSRLDKQYEFHTDRSIQNVRMRDERKDEG